MRIWLNWMVYTVLAFAILVLLALLVLPMRFERRVAVVLTGSMEPSLPRGALAFSVPVEPEDVRIGDVIVFSANEDSDVTTSHRVIEVITTGDRYSFRTKGDASYEADPFLIPAEYVRGKVVFSMPHLGQMINSTLFYIRTWPGLALLVALPSLAVVVSTVRDASRSRSRRYKRLELLRKRRQRLRP